MGKITASSVIDRAIALKNGGVVVVPCSSFEEMEKLRTKMYKLKNQLSKGHSSLARSIDITRKSSNGRWTIYISKEEDLPGVFVIEEGEALPLEELEAEASKETEASKESTAQLSFAEEEEEGEKSFAAIAAEIEANQGTEAEAPLGAAEKEEE